MYYHHIYFTFDSTKAPDRKEINIIENNIDKYCKFLTYNFWDYEKAKTFIRNDYPHFSTFFEMKMDYPIVKCDFFRYLLMYHFGGLYTDLDFICIRDFQVFLDMLERKHISYFPNNIDNPTIVLSEEWLNSSTYTKTLHNGILISLKEKHPFWLKLINEIYQDTTNKTITSQEDVYTLSGPKKLLKYYNENKSFFSDICILPYYYFCPYISIEKEKQELFNAPKLDYTHTKSTRWVFFNIHHTKDLTTLCPNSFFVCICLHTGSMWK